MFSSLTDVSAAEFESALSKSVNHIGTFLDATSGRLGLDHDRVLMGRYATPVITRLLHLNGGVFTDSTHRDKVLYWYVHSALCGRFSGSTETYLQQDYEAVERLFTQDTNIKIGMRDPAEYLAEVQSMHPGVPDSQWIPTNRDLWRVERYSDFLAARRELLAASAQSFLASIFRPGW